MNNNSNIEILIENAILKSLAVQTLQLIMESKDEELKMKVAEMTDKLAKTKGSELNVNDFMKPPNK